MTNMHTLSKTLYLTTFALLDILTCVSGKLSQRVVFQESYDHRSYSSYHPVPVPFNIVSLGAIGLWRLCQGDKGNRSDKTGFDEKGRVRDADKFFLQKYVALDRNIKHDWPCFIPYQDTEKWAEK